MTELRDPAIVLANSSRSWMHQLHFFVVDHGGALVAGYALSPEDVRSAGADILVIDDTCSFLSRRLVDELHGAGTAVLGVFDPSDGAAGVERLQSLGVDEMLPAQAPAEEFVSVIADLTVAVTSDPRSNSEAGERRDGSVVVVTAASGGVGATEVAVGVATQMRRDGESVVLVDADERTPSIAQRLGLAPRPNLETAIEATLAGTVPVEASVVSSGPLPVLCGPASSYRADGMRPADTVAVVRELAHRYRIAVANVGAGPAVGCHSGVAAAVIDMSASIVLVGGASPVGLARIAAWLDASAEGVEGKDLHLVLNRFPGGGYRSGELLDELRRLVHPQSITVLPADRRVQLAEWRGTHVTRGPFHRGVSRVASRLTAEVER